MSQPSVLLVEDNPDTVEFLSKRLRDAGYEVLVARNGADALRVATQEVPSAIVMDINLPQMNGDDVVRRLREQAGTKDLPVIFVTAETEHRVRDLLDEKTMCLEKAIKSKTLLEALDRILGPTPSK